MLVFYSKYRVFWVTISGVSHGTVSNFKNSQFCTTYFPIYVTTLEIGQSAHHVCKWLVIPIKMQGNNVFGNGSGNANSMRFQALPRCSIEVEIVLAPGWNYSLVTWRIISVFLTWKAGDYPVQSVTSLNSSFGRSIIPQKHDLAED